MHRVTVFILPAILLALVPTPALSGNKCLNALKGPFQRITPAMRKIRDGANKLIGVKSGRAQSEEVEVVLAKKQAEAKAEEKTWEDFVKEWEHSAIERMKSRKTYPKVEELLALMAARSPTFGRGMEQFLEGHTAVRWQYRWRMISYFRERVSTSYHALQAARMERKLNKENLSEKKRAKIEERLGGYRSKFGNEVSAGRRLFELWQRRIRLPARRPWGPEEFSLFLTEMSNVLFQINHPEPGFHRAWFGAFGKVRMDPATWNVMKHFVERFQNDYRAHHMAYLKGVSTEAFGKVRPEVIHKIYKFGIFETIKRRILAVTQARSLEELASATVEKDVLFKKEIEQLSLEVTFVVRPIVTGLLLYAVSDFLYSEWEDERERERHEKDVRENPDKYLPTTSEEMREAREQAKNYEVAIEELTILRFEIEEDLKHSSSQVETARLRKELEQTNQRILKLQQLKERRLRESTKVNPYEE